MNKKDKIGREAAQKLGAIAAAKLAKRLAKMQPLTTGAGQIFTQHPLINPWTEWRRTTSLWPRKSINDKWIFGRINKRGRNVWDGAMHGKAKRKRQYATDKELFKGKLRGNA